MYSVLRQFLFSLDPEISHSLAKYSSLIAPQFILKSLCHVSSPLLKSFIGKTPLKNPIGLAAGFDKNAEMIRFLDSLGFGFLELGSVTALPCKGNPKPRLFRLPKDKSIINRMGLPNIGADAFLKRMESQKITSPYGINIAKTPDFAQKDGTQKNSIDDYLESFFKLHTKGSYIVFNLSCPNTNDQKTFEDPKIFTNLAKEIYSARTKLGIRKPVLIKLSPDTNEKTLEKLVTIACEYEFDGFVLTNTTVNRLHLTTTQKQILDIGSGGLSGKALTKSANQQLRKVYNIVGRKKILIGVGGIMSFADLLEKLSCGASHLQIYTGFIYGGPFFVKNLNTKLIKYCKKMGVKNYNELIGQKLN